MQAMLKMWERTEMVVLTAVAAAFYAAAEIALAPLSPVLLPGITGFRLSNIFPLLLGLVFGPAGSWGAGIGNLVGDVFLGGLGLGSIFGFISSCSVGFVAFTASRVLLGPTNSLPGRMALVRSWSAYLLMSILAGATCGVILAWGLASLRIAPLAFVADVVALNMGAGSIVGCGMVRIVARRAKVMGLAWGDIMGATVAARPRFARTGLVLVGTGSICGLLAANLLPADNLLVVGACVGLILVGFLLL